MEKLVTVKVVILEDNDFFNKIITNYVSRVLQELTETHRFTFFVNSYTNCNDCLMNFDPETTLVFTDFYLGEGSNALKLLDYIKKNKVKCKVIVLSQLQSGAIIEELYTKGAYAFFRKDLQILQKCSDLLYSVIEEETKTSLN